MVKVYVAAWVPEVAFAEMVMVKVPTCTRLPVEKVTVTDPPLVIEDEEKLTVMPDGTPLDEKLTVWALPDVVVVVSVEVVEPPGATVPLVGLRLTEKAFGTTAVTVKV